MKSFSRGLKQIARSSFIDAKAAEAAQKGSVVVHLKPNGITPTDFANVMAKQGFAVKVEGMAVTVAKAKVA